MIKLVAASVGVILLISGAVLGATAVQQPFFDFLRLPGTESGSLQMVNQVDCEASPEPNVNWRGCDKSGVDLQGPEKKLTEAILAHANLSDSYLNSIDMSNSSIDGLDLSNSLLFLVNFSGAKGIPTGSNADFYIYTCPNGSAVANYSGDVAGACDWLPAGGAPPRATAQATRERPPNGSPTTAAPNPSGPTPETDCWQGIVNGDFEVTDTWRLQETTHPAIYSQEEVHGGAWAMRTGISDPADNSSGFSSARQTVTIPAAVSTAILSFYLYPRSSEPAQYTIPESEMEAMRSRSSNMGDAQWVTVNDEHGQELEPLLSRRSNSLTWEYFEFNLAGYAGRTIELYFGVYNNGADGITAMYVDDVALTSCPDDKPMETETPAGGEDKPRTEPPPMETPTPAGGEDKPHPETPPMETPTPVGGEDKPRPETVPMDSPTPVTGQDSPIPATPPAEMPTPVTEQDGPLSISGRLLNGQGDGVPGMVLGLNTGETAMTDGQGYYRFNDLEPGAYTVFSPPPYDLVYEPPSRMVDIPPPAGDLLFVGSTPTPEATP